MKRTLFVMAIVLGLATAASAATLSVVSDKASYTPGETITLTITGDNQGASSTTYSLVGRLSYNPALADPGTAGSQLLAGPSWTSQPLAQGDGFQDVFLQADLQFNGAAPNYPGVINTVTLIAQGLGTLNVDWLPSLSFFGIEGATPGVSVNIVPEPTTAVLLGLGLFGLALGGRRRS